MSGGGQRPGRDVAARVPTRGWSTGRPLVELVETAAANSEPAASDKLDAVETSSSELQPRNAGRLTRSAVREPYGGRGCGSEPGGLGRCCGGFDTLVALAAAVEVASGSGWTSRRSSRWSRARPRSCGRWRAHQRRPGEVDARQRLDERAVGPSPEPPGSRRSQRELLNQPLRCLPSVGTGSPTRWSSLSRPPQRRLGVCSTGDGSRACARSAHRSSTSSMPTESRTRPSGMVVGSDFQRRRRSNVDSTPPRLVACTHSAVERTSRSAWSAVGRTIEIIAAEAGVADLGRQRVAGQPAGQLGGVRLGALDAQVQGAQPAQREPRLERRRGCCPGRRGGP